MTYLHNKNIIHRDLKSGNILISKLNNGKLKLKIGTKCNLKKLNIHNKGDFGLSRNYLRNSMMTVGIGTWQYSSPEFFKEETLTWQSDVYSFGIICWELITRQCPYQNLSYYQVLLQLITFLIIKFSV